MNFGNKAVTGQSTDASTEGTAGSTGFAALNKTADGPSDKPADESLKDHALDGAKDATKNVLGDKLNPSSTPSHHAMTADEAGLDVESVDAFTRVQDVMTVAKVGPIGDNTQAIYSSHPIQKMAIGPFQFEKGVLKFTGKEPEGSRVADFERVLDLIPAVDRAAIRKVDQSAAEKLVADHLAIGGASKQFDSGVGRDALERLHRSSPTVGTTELGFEKGAQIDNNAPVPATDTIDESGETGLDQGAHVDPNTQG